MCNSDHFCFIVLYLNLNVSMYAYIGAVVMLVTLLFLSTLRQSKPVQLTILYTVFSIVF